MESSEIKIGDLVEPYRHYEFDETKTAILKPSPSSEEAGTKWRFLGFGIVKYHDKHEPLTIEELEQLRQRMEKLKRYSDIDVDFAVETSQLVHDLDEEPVIELELVEG